MNNLAQSWNYNWLLLFHNLLLVWMETKLLKDWCLFSKLKSPIVVTWTYQGSLPCLIESNKLYILSQFDINLCFTQSVLEFSSGAPWPYFARWPGTTVSPLIFHINSKQRKPNTQNIEWRENATGKSITHRRTSNKYRSNSFAKTHFLSLGDWRDRRNGK